MLEYDFGESDVLGRDPVVDEIARLRQSRGYDGGGALPTVVADSWRRCLADYNLLPDRVPRAAVLNRAEMRDLTDCYGELLSIAGPEIERLFSRLVDSEYLVSFASPQGVMMLFRCDHQFLGDLSSLGVSPGSVWTEERQGTNGVGTCLRVGKPVAIAGRQHYGVATQTLSCMTAPVLGARGSVQSVINVTSSRDDDGRTNRLILDVIQRSARRIENRLFGRTYGRSRVLRLFHDVDACDIAEEGRVAIDDNGLVVDVSSQVGTLTGLSAGELIGRPAEEVLCMDLPPANMAPDKPVSLRFQNKAIHASLQEMRGSRQHSTYALGSTNSEPRDSGVVPMRLSDIGKTEFRTDPMMSFVLDRAQRLFDAGLPIIICGETGSGKTSFAQLLARRSLGNEGDVVFIDCASVARQKAESRVFREGLLRDGACVVLDQFEELDEAGQLALHGLIENRQQSRRGVGIIALSTSNIDELAKSGELRSGLWHRLKGGIVDIPPLRSNPDLPGTIDDLLKVELTTIRREGLRLSKEARLILSNYHWPGNIRELRNALRHAAVLADGDVIGSEHLPNDIVEAIARKDLTARSQSQASRIEAALRHNGGNVSLTARYLGVSRATLYRKIQVQKVREKA